MDSSDLTSALRGHLPRPSEKVRRGPL